ncbi:hypothetical protein L2W99_15185 [Citrobacter freundii]|uniref:small VCP/p97-interacting protein n=1 Tax=Citrobacter freundii TaxID=546 RepID=UPI001A300422|nr:hypothetical protein [Citrobacter freundii]MDE9640049.1 hypothetical protein [Citrobacter freundii]HAT3816460.1 hypothetical protein [Citrobacter freundii]
MTALNKQALRVPERKRHDWSQAVMRDCDFCSQWSLTVKHEDGGCICASCCDAEYTAELKSALESAIDRAEAAEKRIVELEARTVTLPDVEKWRSVDAVRAQNAYKVFVSKVLAAAGIGVKVGAE